MEGKKQWGGARPGAGRKKGVPVKPPEKLRSQTIAIAVTPDLKLKIKEMAKAAGMTVSAFMLKRTLGE